MTLIWHSFLLTVFWKPWTEHIFPISIFSQALSTCEKIPPYNGTSHTIIYFNFSLEDSGGLYWKFYWNSTYYFLSHKIINIENCKAHEKWVSSKATPTLEYLIIITDKLGLLFSPTTAQIIAFLSYHEVFVSSLEKHFDVNI